MYNLVFRTLFVFSGSVCQLFTHCPNRIMNRQKLAGNAKIINREIAETTGLRFAKLRREQWTIFTDFEEI